MILFKVKQEDSKWEDKTEYLSIDSSENLEINLKMPTVHIFTYM